MQFHDGRFQLVWTPFLTRQRGRVMQAVGLVSAADLGSGGEMTLRLGGRDRSARESDLLRYPTGHLDRNSPALYLWLVPRPVRTVKCEATWKPTSGRTCRAAISLPPAWPMNVHVVFARDAGACLIPFTPQSEFLGIEEMCRSLYAARRRAERDGALLPTAAILIGVAAHTASVAMALAAAGGDFLHMSTGQNCPRPDVPPLFWWKLP
ncbi:MAG: hypothetical protein HY718_07580, partial [Planctomycetes bacterium]|nr:hypothetical protein [Planctomycetota bacterium]